MRQPRIANSTVIDLLAEGKTIREIATMHQFKTYSLERQLGRLKLKNDCKTITELVVKMKMSAVSNTVQQPE